MINSDDKLNHSALFVEAKKKEIRGLEERGTWCKVHRRMLPKDANIIGGRFANVLKNVRTNHELAKARYVAQGFRDYMKPFVVHNTLTLRQTSNKVLVSCAVLLSMRICLIDITQAYLQSKNKLTREVYIQVKKEYKELIKVGPHEVLRLNKPLYGMCNSRDY